MRPHCRQIDDLTISVIGLWRRSGRSLFMRVGTASMLPLIRPGDRVGIRMIGWERVHPGDIVAFFRGNTVVVHRLIKTERTRKGRCFWQKGDALVGWGYFGETDFLGKVECVQRDTILLNMSQHPWRALNRLIGLLGWVWVTLYNRMRGLKKSFLGKQEARVLSQCTRMCHSLIRRVQGLLLCLALSGSSE